MKYLLALLVALPMLLHGQENEPKTAAQKVYKQIMAELSSGNFTAIDSLAAVMYQVASEDNDVEGMGNALSTAAMMATYKGDFDTADSLMLLSLTHYREAKMYDDLVSCYGELSGIKRKSGDIELAFEYARKGQALLPKCEREQTQIFNSNILSLLHNVTGQMDSCIYYELDVVKRLPATDSFGLTQAYNNLSSSFLTVGNHQKRKQYLDLALSFSKEKSASRAEVLYKLSDYELGEGNTARAMEYAKSSLAAYKGSKSKLRLKDGHLAVAKVHLTKEEHAAAGLHLDTIASLIGNQNKKYSIDYLLAELRLSIIADQPLANGISIEKIIEAVYEKDHLDHKVRLHGLLNQYYKSKGDYRAAEENLQKQITYSKALTGRRNIQTVNNLEELYKAEQKELQIENLELTNSKQRQQLILGAVALGLISLLSFFLLRLYKKVRAQKSVITKALSEKDLLLREIHHRVKNNLQLVSSLLTLQGRSIDDQMAQQAIREGQSRVRSMALIHQDLYNKENLTGIGAKQYVEKLTQELFDTYRIDKDKVSLVMEVDDLELDVDTLVPLGLIINELITNSLKYAWPGGETGQLTVSLIKVDKKLELKVQDDGVGYDATQVRADSFGSTLIAALTEQLEGEMISAATPGHGSSTIIQVLLR